LPREDSDVKPEVSDAYDALLALGFQLNNIRNVITKVQNENKDLSTEEMIKLALTELR
jgi:Holliday junction resolvasome RuvABC DNA-binding subunit